MTKNIVLLLFASIAVSLTASIFLRKSGSNFPQSLVPAKEWKIPPRPNSEDPQVWLDWIRQVQADYEEITNVLSHDPSQSGICSEMSMKLGRITHDVEHRLLLIGPPSIQPCINQLFGGDHYGVAMTVLANLGKRSVGPLTLAMHSNPESAKSAYDVFNFMKENASSELVEIACKPGDGRQGAIDVLEYVARTYEGRDEPIAIGRPDAFDEALRPDLLQQLKKERNSTTRAQLAAIQRVFRSPDAAVIAELCHLMKSDSSPEVQKAAAESLQQQMRDSSQKGSILILPSVAQVLTSKNDEETIISCSEIVYYTKFPIDSKTINALRQAAKIESQDHRINDYALMALAHQAIYNQDCIPDMLLALDSQCYPTISTAADACIKLGPKAISADAKLREIMQHNTHGMSLKAQEAIVAISRHAK